MILDPTCSFDHTLIKFHVVIDARKSEVFLPRGAKLIHAAEILNKAARNMVNVAFSHFEGTIMGLDLVVCKT